MDRSQNTATLLYGGQGIGKTLLTDTLRMLYGQGNTGTITKHQMESHFTSSADSKQFIVCDEIVVLPKDRAVFAEKLKGLITGHEIAIEAKHANAIDQPNCFNLFFTSNSAAALPLDEDDRRFFIVGSTAGPIPLELRQKFVNWRNSSSGLPALMHHFKQLDLTAFDPYERAPQTSAKRQMLEAISP